MKYTGEADIDCEIEIESIIKVFECDYNQYLTPGCFRDYSANETDCCGEDTLFPGGGNKQWSMQSGWWNFPYFGRLLSTTTVSRSEGCEGLYPMPGSNLRYAIGNDMQLSTTASNAVEFTLDIQYT